jgi:hypothetical protein
MRNLRDNKPHSFAFKKFKNKVDRRVPGLPRSEIETSRYEIGLKI